jgi:hypothetical protein
MPATLCNPFLAGRPVSFSAVCRTTFWTVKLRIESILDSTKPSGLVDSHAWRNQTCDQRRRYPSRLLPFVLPRPPLCRHVTEGRRRLSDGLTR